MEGSVRSKGRLLGLTDEKPYPTAVMSLYNPLSVFGLVRLVLRVV